MNIVSIEPTPSPHTMKINLDSSLQAGERYLYQKDSWTEGPDRIQSLLAIDGIQNIFHTADFIAITRYPQSDWTAILTNVRMILDDAVQEISTDVQSVNLDEGYGQSHVKLQVFRGIPLQVRVTYGNDEIRLSMPEAITSLALQLLRNSPHFLEERKIIDLGVRYGNPHTIAQEIVAEQVALWTEEKLQMIVGDSLQAELLEISIEEPSISEQLQHPDWHIRYETLQQVKPSMETLPYLLIALQDTHVSIRRLATVYVSDIKQPEIISYLINMLQDPSPIVRRTAGDALSDLGDSAAIPAMCQALEDSSKLVRWRAARYLFEIGDESCIEALKKASDDPEFEVRMQAQMALERIQSGLSAEGSVWQQMTQLRENKMMTKENTPSSPKNSMEQIIIQKAKQDELAMILLYAQWCVNHQLDAMALYQQAFPDHLQNLALKQAMKQTLPAEDSPEIPHALVLELLFLFEQTDLAEVVSEQIKKIDSNKFSLY